MNYKQRMIIEILDLKEKIINLENFVKMKVKSKEDEMLKKQIECMHAYYGVLQDRIMIMLEDKEQVRGVNE